MTNRPETFERSVIRSSVMPSAKYSCSGSPLMFWNGRTAMDGFSGSAGGGDRRRRDAVQAHPIGTHRPRDILELLLADILAGKINPSADLFVNFA